MLTKKLSRQLAFSSASMEVYAVMLVPKKAFKDLIEENNATVTVYSGIQNNLLLSAMRQDQRPGQG